MKLFCYGTLNVYQYLLGKVSTDKIDVDFYDDGVYQYLLGKVSTNDQKYTKRESSLVSISIR